MGKHPRCALGCQRVGKTLVRDAASAKQSAISVHKLPATNQASGEWLPARRCNAAGKRKIPEPRMPLMPRLKQSISVSWRAGRVTSRHYPPVPRCARAPLDAVGLPIRDNQRPLHACVFINLAAFVRFWRCDFASVCGVDNLAEETVFFDGFASARTVLLSGSIFSGAVRAPELLATAPVRSCRGSIADGAFGALAERFPIGFFFFFVGLLSRARNSFAV